MQCVRVRADSLSGGHEDRGRAERPATCGEDSVAVSNPGVARRYRVQAEGWKELVGQE